MLIQKIFVDNSNRHKNEIKLSLTKKKSQKPDRRKKLLQSVSQSLSSSESLRKSRAHLITQKHRLNDKVEQREDTVKERWGRGKIQSREGRGKVEGMKGRGKVEER